MRDHTGRPIPQVRAIHARDPGRTRLQPIENIAQALSTRWVRTTPSSIVRLMIDDSLAARIAACADTHIGPVKDDICGHCGATGVEGPAA